MLEHRGILVSSQGIFMHLAEQAATTTAARFKRKVNWR